MSLNKVMLVGFLGADPENKAGEKTEVTKFSLATNEGKETTWHNIVTFGDTAKNCHKYLKKGRQVLVEGRIKNNKWTDKEGKNHSNFEILGDRVMFLDSKSEEAAAAA